MVRLCFYFQVHQPHRLRKYSFFDIGQSHHYLDDLNNKEIVRKVASKCYLPANQLILSLIREHKGQFRVAYSITGTAMEQFRKWSPETLDSFKALAATGCVEFLAETYYHSLSFLFSRPEFERQVGQHLALMQEEFNQVPKVFRNTELIYNNDLAAHVEKMGFSAIVAEGADKILGWRSPNFAYQPKPCDELKLLLKNYRLSDDIAFRFSNRGWSEFPLTADKYARWVHGQAGNAETINLFMDYETFGEHQWAETGIFEFLKHLPRQILAHKDFRFATPSEVAAELAPVAKLDIPEFVSWADTERDLTAWRGNAMQEDALGGLFGMEERVQKSGDADLISIWRKLQTSDHFYYMCTKWFSDGDVHKYFNPYGTPYDAYINYQNVTADLEATLKERGY